MTGNNGVGSLVAPNGPQFVDYMGVRNLVDAAGRRGVKGVRIFSRAEFRMGYISREDVAAIVVASLTDPAARNKAFAAQYDDTVEPGAWRDAFSTLQPE